MKSILLILFCSISLFGYSQNWKPLNASRSPKYAAAGSDSISYGTKIDSVVAVANQTRYYLHPTYEFCMECDSTEAYPQGLYLKKSPLFGEQVVFEAGSYSFLDLGIILKPNLTLGDSYTFSDNGEEITSTVTSSEETTVLTEVDSVKTFGYSNGMELVLSKNHGIISITTVDGTTETLVGIPELAVGTYYPGIRDFYDFDVGDVFMYVGMDYQDDPVISAKIIRIEITGVNYLADTLTINYNRTWKSTYSTNVYTSTGAFSFDNQTQKILLKNSSLLGLVPGMMTYEIDSVVVPDNSINIPFTILDDYYRNATYIDTTEYNGRTALLIGNPNSALGDSISLEGDVHCSPCSDYGWDEENTDWKNAFPLDADENWNFSSYNFLLNDSLVKSDITLLAPNYYISYAEGLGNVAFISGGGLSSSSIFMIGYRKGDEEFGTVYSVSEILSDGINSPDVDVAVYPNPVHDYLSINIPGKFNRGFTISIVDISGREILHRNNIRGQNRINLSDLAPGIYTLYGSNGDNFFSRKVVVE